MKLLLNDKEIARFLIQLVNVLDSCRSIEMNQRHTAGAIEYVIETKSKPKFLLFKHKDKIKQKIHQGVRKDLKAWVDLVNQQIANHKEYFYKNIHKHLTKKNDCFKKWNLNFIIDLRFRYLERFE